MERLEHSPWSLPLRFRCRLRVQRSEVREPRGRERRSLREVVCQELPPPADQHWLWHRLQTPACDEPLAVPLELIQVLLERIPDLEPVLKSVRASLFTCPQFRVLDQHVQADRGRLPFLGGSQDRVGALSCLPVDVWSRCQVDARRVLEQRRQCRGGLSELQRPPQPHQRESSCSLPRRGLHPFSQPVRQVLADLPGEPGRAAAERVLQPPVGQRRIPDPGGLFQRSGAQDTLDQRDTASTVAQAVRPAHEQAPGGPHEQLEGLQ